MGGMVVPPLDKIQLHVYKKCILQCCNLLPIYRIGRNLYNHRQINGRVCYSHAKFSIEAQSFPYSLKGTEILTLRKYYCNAELLKYVPKKSNW
jgi:hypothetical protein